MVAYTLTHRHSENVIKSEGDNVNIEPQSTSSQLPQMHLSSHTRNAALAGSCMIYLVQCTPIAHEKLTTFSTNSSVCYRLPGDNAWPGPNEWETFNASVTGHLIRASPLAASCHGSSYDRNACERVKGTWTDGATL